MVARMDLLPLAPRARLLFYLQAFSRLGLVHLPLALVGGAVVAAFWGPVWGFGLGAAWLGAQLLLALWWPWLAFDRWGYALREEDLIITHGVIWRHTIAIPAHRVQHVDLWAGPIEQALGLVRLQISTASGMGADGVIPGLEVEVAEDLRDALVRHEGDDGV